MVVKFPFSTQATSTSQALSRETWRVARAAASHCSGLAKRAA